jgi:PIN domain nuclease of toxin-antitoxin system
LSLANLEEAIPRGDRILLDASALIGYLSGGEDVTPIMQHIMTWVRSDRNEAIVSVVSVMEILVRPLRVGTPSDYQTIMDFLTYFPHLSPTPLDLSMAMEAAALRARYGFSPPDALTIATGLLTQSVHLVTNDEEWIRKLRLLASRTKVCYLKSYLPLP